MKKPWIHKLLRFAFVLVFLIGLFILGTFIPTPGSTTAAEYETPAAVADAAPNGGGTRSAVIASFTALIPEPLVINLPSVLN